MALAALLLGLAVVGVRRELAERQTRAEALLPCIFDEIIATAEQLDGEARRASVSGDDAKAVELLRQAVHMIETANAPYDQQMSKGDAFYFYHPPAGDDANFRTSYSGEGPASIARSGQVVLAYALKFERGLCKARWAKVGLKR